MSRRNLISGIGAAAALLLTGASVALAQSASLPAWDSNHDGVYTCDEWKAYMARLFTSADRNHDGKLDPTEFAIIKKADPTLADADFGYFDENQDGKITRSEFVDKPSQFILQFDKNGDCRVTPDEIKAGNTPKQEGEKPHGRPH